MAVPKVFFAVPLVVIGAVAPALADNDPLPRRPNLVGMEQLTFDRDTITIEAGEQLRLVNNSNFLHVIGPGDKARIEENATKIPRFGPDNVRTMPRGEPYATDAWDSPGTYSLTCTLHPEMNMTVVVNDR